MSPRIIGLLFSGFMIRLYGCGMAIYVAVITARFVSHAFGAVDHALKVLP